ncbi:MAG: ribose 5-phosphate isomerase B [Candidatus Omnitrophica bacterium]|nr:ribose 5-phosphate isomerase B [Candidatus Omnitrophota bacterium]
MAKRIAIGSDHGGFKLKELLKVYLLKKGYAVKDFGAYTSTPSDYPLIGYKVAKSVSSGKIKKGIAICKTGIGMAIIANKLPGVRSAVCNNTAQAKTSRLHNDTNVLSLAAKFVNSNKAKKIVNIWLTTKAEGHRHKRRVNQINQLEKKR